MHFHQLCLFYLPLGSEIVESFHVTTSRQLNSRIVVPTAGKVSKARPRASRIVVPTAGNVSEVRARVQKLVALNHEPLATPGPDRPRVLDPEAALANDHPQSPDKAPRLVKNAKMKNNILDDYQKEFGNGKPIVTSQLGTSENLLQPPSQYVLMRSCSMKPELKKHYSSDPICFYNVAALVMNSFLSPKEFWVIAQLNKFMSIAVPDIKRLLLVDWRPLLQPRYNYELQTSIDNKRVDMATALAIRCGFDPGKIVRTLGGEYTASWRDVTFILENVQPVVSSEDYDHIKKILTCGCPSVLKFEEPLSNKLK